MQVCSASRIVTRRVTSGPVVRNTFAAASITRNSIRLAIQHAHFHATANPSLNTSFRLHESLERSRYGIIKPGDSDDFYLPFIQSSTLTQQSGHVSPHFQKNGASKRCDHLHFLGGLTAGQAQGDKEHSHLEHVKDLRLPPENNRAYPRLVGRPEKHSPPTTTFHEISSNSSTEKDTARFLPTLSHQNDATSARGLQDPARSRLPKQTRNLSKTQSRLGAIPSNNVGIRRSGNQRETWQIQKAALVSKFGSTGWVPRKRLSPDALDGIRALHAQFPEKYTTPVLASQFEVSPDAIRRILKSKWRPSDEEVTSRRQRWDKRGERIWGQMAMLGIKPPKAWREIRVSVEWDRPAVFAGESLECVITFKNVAEATYSKRTISQVSNHNSPRERWKDHTAADVRHQALGRSPRQRSGTDYTKDYSKILSHGSTWNATSLTSTSSLEKDTHNDRHGTSRRLHRRSVSIGSVIGGNTSSEQPLHAIPASKRHGQGHGRAASLQVLPGKSVVSNQTMSTGNQVKGSSPSLKGHVPAQDRATIIPAFLRSSKSSSVDDKAPPTELWNPEIPTAVSSLPLQRNISPVSSATNSPQVGLTVSAPSVSSKPSGIVPSNSSASSAAPTQFTRRDQPQGHQPRVLSPISTPGTPRTSADLYPGSSNSSDTMASEYVAQEPSRFSHHSISTQQQPHHVSPRASQPPEDLMMGYGNVVGSFQLDASLIDTNYFDGVKKKAVIGNQGGGGVVRAETTKRQSGLLGSLGWSALGESLEGLLGGSHGETMGHDLMSPHVMLHSEPLITAVKGDYKGGTVFIEEGLPKRHTSVEEGFLSYTSQLLDTSCRDSGLGLLSPSTSRAKSPIIGREEPATMEGAISLAIQRSNSGMSSKLSANRFEILRSGNRVAVIMLARPAYRLGESIPVVVDFHESAIRCLWLRVTLETSEHVDPNIALRSSASILRVSRRILATQHESTVSAERIYFSLAIPNSSTPEFITSGVNLEWKLRFEYLTMNRSDTGGNFRELLEEVAEDERGTVSVAVETMPCETFEVTLPLHVYGGISEFDDIYRQAPKWFEIS
ncbi:MAG: hypothetical protein Q9182_006960 [Xanthomendoza sp. 2 TL-2023]